MTFDFVVFYIFLFFIFLFLSGTFSLLQTACTSLSSHKVGLLVSKNIKFHPLIKILSNPQKLLLTLYIGQNLFSSAAVITATSIILFLFKNMTFSFYAAALVTLTLILSLLMVVFTDMVPKALAVKHPHSVVLFFARPLLFSIWILTPFILIFEWIMAVFSKFSGHIFLDANQILTADEIRNLINMGEKEGVLESVEKEMIDSIFTFSDTIAREIMTPRTDMISVEISQSVSQVVKMIKSYGHSRIPVYDKSLDNIVGVVFAKDLLGISDPSVSVALYIRELKFIPETQNIVDLLHQMKKNKLHISIVVDEYGDISGLVTLEDIIEEIIGEIQDEYDKDEKPDFVEVNPGHYVVDAGINIDDLGERLNVEFPKSEDFDTIGGFVLSLLGRFPNRGQVVTYSNLQIKVKEISRRRILSVEIYVMAPEESESIV